MNRFKNILWFSLPVCLFIILYVLDFNYQCPFKRLLHIPCIGCGMTRAVVTIIHGNFLESFRYNLMALPLIIIGLVSVPFVVVDIIKNQTTYINKIDQLVQKYSIFIFGLVTVVWLFNLILNGKRL